MFSSIYINPQMSCARLHSSMHVGCRFVVVDAKQSAVKFYERLVFTLLDTTANKASDQPVM